MPCTSNPARRRLLIALAFSICLLNPAARGGDCNQNGFDDIAEVLDGRSPDCNQNGVPDDCDLRPVNPVFESHAELFVEEGLGSPREIRFADLDSDGDADLLAPLYLTETPSTAAVSELRHGGRRRRLRSRFHGLSLTWKRC